MKDLILKLLVLPSKKHTPCEYEQAIEKQSILNLLTRKAPEIEHIENKDQKCIPKPKFVVSIPMITEVIEQPQPQP